MDNYDFEKIQEAFSEGMAEKYATQYEPLAEALEKEKDRYSKVYEAGRPLLDRYEKLMMQIAGKQIRGGEKEMTELGAKLSAFIQDVKIRGEQSLETVKYIQAEMDRVERFFFPPKEDIERN